MIRAVDKKPYILFVDDEDMTRKTFERIASSEFPVLLACDVAEAIDTLKKRGDEIGVILTDQRMPGGLGIELLEYARDQHPEIVRMLTTAYSDIADAIAAVNRGEIIRYIEKPWTNIDALLIDLRVAIQFYLLERSNNELMAEKMSAKARGDRIERIQVLVTLAASQSNPELALIAAEDMLRTLSELCSEQVENGQSKASDLFLGPVGEVNRAMALARRFSQSLTTSNEGSWEELSSVPVSGNAASEVVPESLGGLGAELIERALALMGGRDSSPKIIAESTGEGMELSFVSGSERNKALDYWVNIGSDDNSVSAIADLLKLYLLTYSSGATIDINFDEEDALVGLKIYFSNQGNGRLSSTQDSDWLEDIAILFS